MKKIKIFIPFIALLVLNACKDDVNFSTIDTLSKLSVECTPHQQSNYIECEINDAAFCLGQSAQIIDVPIQFTDTTFSTFLYKAVFPIEENGRKIELLLNCWIHKDSLLAQNGCVFKVNDVFKIEHPLTANEKVYAFNIAGITFTWDKNDRHEAFVMQTNGINDSNKLIVKDLVWSKNNGVIKGTITLEGEFDLYSFNAPPCFFCGDVTFLPNTLHEIANVKKTIIKFNFIQE